MTQLLLSIGNGGGGDPAPSPAMTERSLLPELGYPTRESTVGVDVGVEGEVEVPARNLEVEGEEGEGEDQVMSRGVDEVEDGDERMEEDGSGVKGAGGKMLVEEAGVGEEQVVEQVEEEDEGSMIVQEEHRAGQPDEESIRQDEDEANVLPVEEKEPSPARRASVTPADKSMTPRAPAEQAELPPVKRLPLFFPDSSNPSRSTTAFPSPFCGPGMVLNHGGNDDQWRDYEICQNGDGDEVKEEQEAPLNSLPSPESTPHHSPRHSPRRPSTPSQLQREPSPELEGDHASSFRSPSPAPVPTSPIRQKTPVIDVSQVMPSQSQPRLSSHPLSPRPPRLYPTDVPKTPQSTTPRTHITSSEEAAHITALLTTLSEPSSSEDEDEEDEDEVDELLPSELSQPSPKPEHGSGGMEDTQETYTTNETVVCESSIRSFTPRVVEKDSIQSLGEGATVRFKSPIVDSVHRRSSPTRVLTSPTHDEQECEGDGRVQMQVGDQPDLEYHHEPSPQLQPSPEPEREVVVRSPTAPTSPVQTRQEPVTPVPLPDYLSPVNTPSPSRSPLITTRLGVRRERMSRKRKLEEMESGGGSGHQTPVVEIQTRPAPGVKTPVMKVMTSPMEDYSLARTQQTRREGQGQMESPLRGKVRMMKTSKGSVAVSASPAKRVFATMSARRTVTPASRARPELSVSTSARDGKRTRREEKVVQREDSPIYVSSTPSTPTQEKDQQLSQGGEMGVECIDLTHSPEHTRRQAKAAAKEGERVLEKSVEKKMGTNALAGRVSRAILKAQRERERRKEQERNEREEREQREKERKRKKEKERKMLPVGAEDSDDAEVIPATSFKKPQVLGLEPEGERDQNVGNVRPSRTAPKVPKLDLNVIAARQAANGKESKAMTKVKRRGRTSAVSSAKDREDDEPPLKRARLRSEDRDSVASNGSPELRRSRRKSEDKVTKSGREKENVFRDTNFDPPSSPVRVSWPVKRAGSRFDKNVSFLVLFPGL